MENTPNVTREEFDAILQLVKQHSEQLGTRASNNDQWFLLINGIIITCMLEASERAFLREI